MKAAKHDSFSPADIKAGISVAGVAGSGSIGSFSTCTTDNQAGCVTTATYRSADTTAILATDLKSGKTIAGIAGALTNCSAGGDAGCIVVGPAFKAADMSVVTAGNIKAGINIAGVAGDYPSSMNPLSGASGTTDLTSMAAATAAGTYEFWDSTGTRYSGDITDASTITPGTSNQNFNTSLYRQFTISGDANLVAGKIKNGVSLFGVSGDYPSATHPLTGADSTADLDLATFDAKIKSSTSFEWFDAYGTRYTNGGNSDITASNIVTGVSIFGTSGSVVVSSNCTSDGQVGCVTTATYPAANTTAFTAWDIRKGITIGGVAGELTHYKNMARTALFDRASGDGGATGIDFYDSIEEYNANYATFPYIPTENPTGWYQSTGANWIMNPTNDTGTGSGGVASDGLCNGTEACVIKDRFTNLMWAKADSTTRTWETAITFCEGSSYGTFTDWRVPTQKELMQAYSDGIWSQKDSTHLNLTISAYYWTSTTAGSSTTNAWIMGPGYGEVLTSGKTTSTRVICVRP